MYLCVLPVRLCVSMRMGVDTICVVGNCLWVEMHCLSSCCRLGGKEGEEEGRREERERGGMHIILEYCISFLQFCYSLYTVECITHSSFQTHRIQGAFSFVSERNVRPIWVGSTTNLATAGVLKAVRTKIGLHGV